MQCYITPLLHLELTQVFCSFVIFPSAPLIVFLVAMKKCAMPLSEPLVDHRPRSEMVRRSWCVGGPRGYCHRRIRWGARGYCHRRRIQDVIFYKFKWWPSTWCYILMKMEAIYKMSFYISEEVSHLQDVVYISEDGSHLQEVIYTNENGSHLPDILLYKWKWRPSTSCQLYVKM